MRLVAILFMLFAAYSCSNDSSDSPGNSGNVPDNGDDNSHSTYLINGKSPSDFYAQFYYEEGRKKDENGEYDVFNYVSSDSEKIGQKLDEENQKCASFKIALNEDHSFIANYTEEYCLQSSDRPHTWDPVFEKKIFGEWSIENMNLKLGNFALATGFRLNGSDTLKIRLTEIVNLKIMSDTDFIGHYRMETVFPFDED